MRNNLIILAGFFLLLTSCFRNDLENIKFTRWNPDLAVPLIKSQFTLGDIIAGYDEDGMLVTDSTGFITLIINRDNVFTLQANEFFEVPSQIFSITDTIQSLELEFPGDELIQTLGIREGKLIFHLDSMLQQAINVNIDIPQATLGDLPLHEEIILQTLTSFTDTIDLSGYTLDLTGYGDEVNRLEIKYDARRLLDSLPTILENFSVSLQDVVFDYADGFFGTKNFSIKTDTISLQFLKNWTEGTIYINNPEIGVTLHNDFGMPFFLELSNFQAENTVLSVPISGTVFTDSIAVSFLTDSLSIGSATTEVAIDSSNSNIENVIAFSPQNITYQLMLSVNSTSNNMSPSFLYDSSELVGNVQLKLPFQGRIDNLILQDTFDLDINTIEELTKADFTLTVTNTFPVNAQIQVLFVDTDFQVIDSLLTSPDDIIISGVTNTNGEVIAPITQISKIAFDKEKLENLFSSRKLIVRAQLSAGSVQQPSIRFLSSSRIEIHLGVIAGVTSP